jgi:hypothetical protein
MEIRKEILRWLLNGDPAIRWQVLRDLSESDPKLIKIERQKVAQQGWGAKILAHQDASGQFGGGIYSPKWISTTYTMLLLKRLGLDPQHRQMPISCKLLLDKGFYEDGGINYFPSFRNSETCVTGMILSVLCYFQTRDRRIHYLVDYLLREQLPDGGWNCRSFKGDKHGSFHTTISVLEGLYEFQKKDTHASQKITESRDKAIEFLLVHYLFKSHRTGKIADPKMTRISFPPRWRYDILRVLDYFQEAKIPYDLRMEDALEIVRKKQRSDGKWFLQNKHPGRVFFDMEKVGKPSRWNTLRALRVLKFYPAKDHH